MYTHTVIIIKNSRVKKLRRQLSLYPVVVSIKVIVYEAKVDQTSTGESIGIRDRSIFLSTNRTYIITQKSVGHCVQGRIV